MSKHDQHLPSTSQLFLRPSNDSASRPSISPTRGASTRQTSGRRQRTRRPLDEDPTRHPARHAARPISRPRRAEPRQAAHRAVDPDPVSIPQLAGIAVVLVTFFSAVLFL